MKVPLRRHLELFPKLHRRLSSVRWTLLLITTTMFFLSAASTGCPTGGYTLTISPMGPSVQNNPPPASGNPPPAPGNPPPQPTTNVPGITPILIPTIPGNPTVGSPTTGSPIANPPPSGGGNTVTINVLMNATGFVFDKPTMTIKKGTTVTWVRGAGDDGSAPHTITCGTATNPKLGDCAKDAFNVDFPTGTNKVSHTFSTAGTYKYLCSVHPATMLGTITVTP